MKKILCLAFVLGVFSSGEAYAVVSASQDRYVDLQQREVMTIGGGGGGGGTTIYQKPVDTIDTFSPVTQNPVVSDWEPITTPSVTPVVNPSVTPITTSATVSSCPSGTTMSADKCCCVNN